MSPSLQTLKSFTRCVRCVCVTLSLLVMNALPAQDTVSEEGKDSGPMMRVLCVSSLSEEEEELVLASKNEEGEWTEHSAFKLRSSFITPWMKFVPGRVHIARRADEGLESIGSFDLKPEVKRPIVILLPDVKNNRYRADVIHPDELGFRKGTAFVMNYSKMPALVMLGAKRTPVKPGERVATSPKVGEDGMYRMVVGYQKKGEEIVACYDRYVAANQDSRNFLLLFPDPVNGLRVYSLPEFGPFE